MRRERAPDFRGYYAHVALSGVQLTDIRVVFCEIDPTAPDTDKKGPILLEKCSIVLSPEAARRTGEMLIRQADLWEKRILEESESPNRK